jgi:tagatose-1,6-bisphosphate aldolase non-catalytic subunit AgaZ/GatZ
LYWPEPAAARAADALLQRIEGWTMPMTVARQFLPWLAEAGSAGMVRIGRRSVIEHVQGVLRQYRAAEQA